MTVAEPIAFLQVHDPATVVVLASPTYFADDAPIPFRVADAHREVRAVQLRSTSKQLLPRNEPPMYTYESSADGDVQGVLVV